MVDDEAEGLDLLETPLSQVSRYEESVVSRLHIGRCCLLNGKDAPDLGHTPNRQCLSLEMLAAKFHNPQAL